MQVIQSTKVVWRLIFAQTFGKQYSIRNAINARYYIRMIYVKYFETQYCISDARYYSCMISHFFSASGITVRNARYYHRMSSHFIEAFAKL